jgi:hypothetical protein
MSVQKNLTESKNHHKDILKEEKTMGRPRTEKGPQKDLRIVVSAEAHARILAQAKLLDQTPASFARQVIMEKVTALEAAGSQGGAVSVLKQMIEMGKEMEEKR